MSEDNGKEKKERAPSRTIVEQIIDAYNALHPGSECQTVAFVAAAPGSWRLAIDGATVSESHSTPSATARDYLATAHADLHEHLEKAKAEASQRAKQLRALGDRTRAFGDKHRGTLPGI